MTEVPSMRAQFKEKGFQAGSSVFKNPVERTTIYSELKSKGFKDINIICVLFDFSFKLDILDTHPVEIYEDIKKMVEYLETKRDDWNEAYDDVYCDMLHDTKIKFKERGYYKL